MIEETITNKRLQVILPIVVFTLAVVARLIPGPRTVDDAYITYRYSRNLVSGNGFVYNLDERVLGTTTPLYTLMLAGLSLFFGGENAPFPTIAMVVNAFADGLTCILLFSIGQKLGSWRGGFAAGFVWAIAPHSVTFAIGGLETSVVVLLLTGMTFAYLQTFYTWTTLLAGLALLTRPDTLIFILPLAIDRIRLSITRPEARIHWAEIAAGALPLVLWYGFATLYFGSPISHSVTAKALAYRLQPEEAFVRLIQHYATPFMGHLTFGIPWIGVGLVLFPTLYLIGSWRAFNETRRIWPFLLFPGLYFAVFSLANPLIFRWYLTPPLPLYFLMILIGGDQIIRQITHRVLQKLEGANQARLAVLSSTGLTFLVVLIPGLMSLRAWNYKPDHGYDRPAPDMAWYKLELLYRQAADVLQPLTDESTVLAASDVGVLGFYTSAKILDTVGLNSPQVLDYYPVDPSFYVINLATSPDLIIDTQPDYVVLLEVYGREGLFKDSRFHEQYDLLEKLPNDIYGSDGMLIFGRTEPP